MTPPAARAGAPRHYPRVIDAEYKAHLAERDGRGRQRFTEDCREAHRADVHQMLAYAALYSTTEVGASLVYLLWHAPVGVRARSLHPLVTSPPPTAGAISSEVQRLWGGTSIAVCLGGGQQP